MTFTDCEPLSQRTLGNSLTSKKSDACLNGVLDLVAKPSSFLRAGSMKRRATERLRRLEPKTLQIVKTLNGIQDVPSSSCVKDRQFDRGGAIRSRYRAAAQLPWRLDQNFFSSVPRGGCAGTRLCTQGAHAHGTQSAPSHPSQSTTACRCAQDGPDLELLFTNVCR